MPEQEKSRQPKVVGVEPRAGEDPNRSEKPGWSVGDMDAAQKVDQASSFS